MNIYNISASKSFLMSLVIGIEKRFGNDPKIISRINVLLPSKRACKAFELAFIKYSTNDITVIPRAHPIGELDEDEINVLNLASDFPELSLDIIPPISELEQKIILVRLIRENHPSKYQTFNQASTLAESLINFFYDFRRDDIDIAKIQNIDAGDASHSWQEMLEFLNIILDKYPKALKALGKTDPINYRNNLIKARSLAWQLNKPNYPVIIAGSTGSIEVTRQLIKTIANFKNGYAILPSLDLNISENDWNQVDYSHPQYNLKVLCDYLNVKRGEINEWDKEKSTYLNSNFISEIFRPNITTDKWHLINKDICIDNVTLIECENQSEEAKVVSLILRTVLETPDKIAAVVTSDSGLSKRIKFFLKRYKIKIDDSQGELLEKSTKTQLFLLLLKLIENKFSAVELLSILKHELVSFETNEHSHIEMTEMFEKKILRGLSLKSGLSHIINKIGDEDKLLKWFNNLPNNIKDFLELSYSKKNNFKVFLVEHIKAVEKLLGVDNPNEVLYSGDDGIKLHNFLLELLTSADKIGVVNFNDYSEIFQNFLKKNVYRSKDTTHRNIRILTPIEARHIETDLVILAGMNENIWPSKMPTNPWVSKTVRLQLGLSSEMKLVGLSAHDFYKLLHTKEVIITRSNNANGSPAIASRWVVRMKVLAKYLDIENMLESIKPWKEWAKNIDKETELKKISRPSPSPKIKFRPKKLSVTQIEKLIRNPYSIYSSEILKLRPLEIINKEPASSDFGNFIHKAFDVYNKSFSKIKNNHKEHLLAIGEGILEQYKDTYVYNFWRSRFINIVNWFIKNDLKLRLDNTIFSEISGQYQFKVNSGLFTISAKADLICVDKNNFITIIDYKTGSIPSNKDIYEVVKPQLTLEGVIATKSGFKCLQRDEDYTVKNLSYILLKGNEIEPEIKDLDINKDIDSVALIKHAELKIQDLIKSYDSLEKAYTAHPDSNITSQFDEYEHLARVKEWK